jgi:hypothetical protein
LLSETLLRFFVPATDLSQTFLQNLSAASFALFANSLLFPVDKTLFLT